MATKGTSWLATITSVLLVLMTMNLVGADPNAENLREIVRRLQPKLRVEATEMDLMYWPGLLAKFPDLQHLTASANQFRAAAVDLVIEGAREKERSVDPMPFISQSTLVIGAMYGLTPTDYLAFADQVLSRAEAERVVLDDAELGALISPRHELTGLFARNYQQPRVREVLEKAKRLWVAQSTFGKVREPDLAKAIDETLTGRTALWLDRQKERYPDEYPNNLKSPALAGGGPLSNENVAVETPPGITPAPTAPVAIPKQSASPSSSEPVAPAPAVVGEKRAPIWPWVVGIAALVVIVAVALKRRA